MHVEKYKCEKCKRVCKERKYIYIYIYIYKNYKVTPNRNVNKETNTPNKEIYKNSRYMEIYVIKIF